MTEVMFQGLDGRLEGRHSAGPEKDSPIALITHAHPLYGGKMNNTVPHKLHHKLHDLGFSVLRFNFRGVGKSQGEFDEGVGELADSASALDFLQSLHPSARSSWVIGFSFGAWVGLQLLMRRPDVAGFVAISPPANMYDFSFLSPCPAPGLIINGTGDKFVPPKVINLLVKRLTEEPDIDITHETVQGAGHLYDQEEHLDELAGKVGDYLRKRTRVTHYI